MTSKNVARDVHLRSDIEEIVARFYAAVLKDPIVGFIFTDVAKIDLEHHLPVIVDFWADSLFHEGRYSGNPLRKHLELHEVVALKPGHFTRWLYLFNRAVDEAHAGANAETMKRRAERVAKSISAAITAQKRRNVRLTIEDYQGNRAGLPESSDK